MFYKLYRLFCNTVQQIFLLICNIVKIVHNTNSKYEATFGKNLAELFKAEKKTGYKMKEHMYI